MTLDARTLRPYAPLAVLIVSIAAGWMVFVRPVAAERARAAAQVERLRARELTLRRDMSEPSPGTIDADPAAAFERQIATGNASPALLEQLARLASEAHGRNLLIETVEGPADANSPAQLLLRDPRFSLFDLPVSSVPIRVAFDTDYASAGRFLWAFRDLPTTVEIRALSIRLPPADAEDAASSTRADVLRVSLTLHAYSRSSPAVLQASNTVAR